jgi:serine/threonine protein kinase
MCGTYGTHHRLRLRPGDPGILAPSIAASHCFPWWLTGLDRAVPSHRTIRLDNEERLKAALADCYRIEREIGSDGMATVYLAQDLKHDRKVAVKVLRPSLGLPCSSTQS